MTMSIKIAATLTLVAIGFSAGPAATSAEAGCYATKHGEHRCGSLKRRYEKKKKHYGKFYASHYKPVYSKRYYVPKHSYVAKRRYVPKHVYTYGGYGYKSHAHH